MVKKKTFVDKNGLQLVELPSQGASPNRKMNQGLSIAKKRSTVAPVESPSPSIHTLALNTRQTSSDVRPQGILSPKEDFLQEIENQKDQLKLQYMYESMVKAKKAASQKKHKTPNRRSVVEPTPQPKVTFKRKKDLEYQQEVEDYL